MTKKRGMILFVVVAGIVGVAVWLTKTPGEPTYQGRSMGAWLQDLNTWFGDTNAPAFIAFREMGTNAIPGLLRILQSRRPFWQTMISKFNRKQTLVELPIGSRPPKLAASTALYAMGPDARPALQALTNLLFNGNALTLSTVPLAGIGSVAVPSLLAALTNRNEFIRHAAALGLGYERDDLNLVVPALVARLDDSNRLVRTAAVMSLGQLHTQSELVVPALMKDFQGNDALTRSTILTSLSEFETNAKTALPMVMSALKDGDGLVRQCASNALQQIDPDAAAKAGVK